MSISCDCSCDHDYCPEFFAESFPVARKGHKCCECGEEINPGQKYSKETGKWEGEFRTYKTCMPCYRIRERYCPNGYIYGNLAEQLFNCLGFDYRYEVDEEEDGS